jgi:hypothetical protein
MMSFVMYPCAFFISHNYIARQLQHLESKRIKDCSSPYEGLTIIKKLMVKDSTDEDHGLAVQILKKGFLELRDAFPESNMPCVWESLYCCFKEDKPALAQVKISKHSSVKKLDSMYLTYQLSRYYASIIRSEDVTYLQCLKEISQVKEDDHHLCSQLVQIYDLLVASKNDPNAVEGRVTPMYSLLGKIKRTYKRLTQIYTKRPEVLELYGHFMVDVMNDASGQQYIAFGDNEKSLIVRSVVAINRIESLFNADVGILVVGGAKDEVGCILYANEEIASLLEANVIQLIGQELNTFIPPPYSTNHNSKMEEFLDNLTANRIFRSHLVLYTLKRHIVEVTFEIRVLAMDYRPYFLVAVRGKPDNRDLAIYDHRGLITSSTQKFQAAFGQGRPVEGLNLDVMFPGIWEKRHDFPDFVPFLLNSGESVLAMIFTHATLRLSNVNFLYVLRSSDALEELIEGREIDPKYDPLLAQINHTFLEINSRRMKAMRSLDDQSRRVNFIADSQFKREKVRVQLDDPQTDANVASRISSSSLAVSRHDRFKDLKKITFSRGRRLKKILAVAFLVVLGIMIGLILTIQSFIAGIADISTISELGARRMLSVKIATESRTLLLIDQGLSTAPRNASVTTLEAIITRFSAAEDLAENERNRGFDLGKDEIIPIWKRMPEMTQEMVTGREAVKQLIFYATQLTSSTTDQAVFYGLRNGVGETSMFLNRTLFEYVQREVTTRFDMISFVALMMASGTVFVMSVYVLILAPNIYYTESSSHTCFNQLKVLSRESVIEGRMRVLERLEFVHGEEPYVLERDQTAPTAYKRVWPGLALRFCMFIAVTVLVLVAAFLIYLYKLNDLLMSNPHYSNWAGLRRMTIASAMFWSRELHLSHTGQGYFDTIDTDQLQYSYHERIANSTATLYWAHKSITHGRSGVKEIGQSADRIAMLYEAYPNNTLQLDYGVHSGVLEFISIVDYFVAEPTIDNLSALEALGGKLILAMEDLMNTQQDYIDSAVEEASASMMWLLVAYGGVLLGLYCYYSRVINNTNNSIVAVARLYTLIPDVGSSDDRPGNK